MTLRRPTARVAAAAIVSLIALVATSAARAAAAEVATTDASKIAYVDETLPNGLRVIYAPLHQAPVVHVRVLYHVGSRDERPDRQGFAHMFEHMMFRGSAHVKPEQHMQLIGVVGGYSNAFTSFDQTVYVNTVPANSLEMALYLEADRMASFKVSEEIYKTERKVVAEEWRMGQNKPYGTMYQDFLKNAFTAHSYRWTPIGNMQHLSAAQVNELQDFYNTYYLPNNAVLAIAGDFEVESAKAMVRKYYGWIPAGPAVKRQIPAEPVQAELRRAVTPQFVPLPAIMLGFKTPPYRSDEHYALGLLAAILGDGRSSRLQQLLVNSDKPAAVQVGASDWTLEDAGVFLLDATVLNGRDPAAVEQALLGSVATVLDKGVSEEELAKAKTQQRVAKVNGLQTADQLATQLGDEALFGGDPNRVNTELAKIEAVTVAQISEVAKKYLQQSAATVLFVKPDPLGRGARAAAATQADAAINAPVAPASRPVEPRVVTFPEGYPTTPPMADAKSAPEFKKGTELTINGVRVIVMTDNRLPLVTWTLTMRRGSHSEPAGQEGTAGITAEMLRRGTQAQPYAELNEDLESRGISLGTNDGGDFTRLTGAATTEQFAHGLERTREVLLQPRFDPAEFEKVREQLGSQLMQAQEVAGTVAGHELGTLLYPNSPVSRYATPQSVANVTLAGVKAFYDQFYRPSGAVLVFAGDVTTETGKRLAEELLKDWQPAPEPTVAYPGHVTPSKRKILIVDRPDARQATIHMGIPAYDITSDEKYAGSLASQILTAGIDSRLGKYVRAEKGLVYGIHGVFSPGRHEGMFEVGTDTRIDATAETIEAALKVLGDMRAGDVTSKELSDAQLRVTGSMVMRMQTIGQQATMRVEGIMNDYPIDYYDKYPSHVAAVTAAQVRAVMNKYVDLDKLTIVVVAPADAVKGQLEKLGDVEVIPMPARRQSPATRPAAELVKPGT